MTNVLTATKTPKPSSQGIPDVILVLNKEEKKEKHRKTKNKEKRRNTTKKRSARTSKGTCTRSHTSKGTRTSKKAHAATRSRFYIIIRKVESRKTKI